MGRGRERDGENERKRLGKGGKEIVRGRERWFRISHWSKWSHRRWRDGDGERLKEMERDGERWRDMGRHGERWGDI